MTEPTYRFATIIALIQAGVVVAGTLFVAAMLRLYGYGGDQVSANVFDPTAVFVRNYGFTLLLIPAGWACFATFAINREYPSWVQRLILGVGLLLILFGIFRYVQLGFRPVILPVL